MLTLLQDLEEEISTVYTDEFVAEPDHDYNIFMNGGKTYSREEFKDYTHNILKSLQTYRGIVAHDFQILIPYPPVILFGTSIASVRYMCDTRDRRYTEHVSNIYKIKSCPDP